MNNTEIEREPAYKPGHSQLRTYRVRATGRILGGRALARVVCPNCGGRWLMDASHVAKRLGQSMCCPYCWKSSWLPKKRHPNANR